MNIHRIEKLEIEPQRPPSWDSPPWKNNGLIATLDDGTSVRVDRHVNGVVPIVGDYFFDGEKGREVFQLYRIARIEFAQKTGLMIHTNSEKNLILENGARLGDSELAIGHPLFQIGDYLIRKIDGYHVVPKLRFESENGEILHILRGRALRERAERGEAPRAAPVRAKKGTKRKAQN